MSEGEYHRTQSPPLVTKVNKSNHAPETFPFMPLTRLHTSSTSSSPPAGNGCGPHIEPGPSFLSPSFLAHLSLLPSCRPPLEPETSFPDWPDPVLPPSAPANAPLNAAAPSVSALCHYELYLQTAVREIRR